MEIMEIKEIQKEIIWISFKTRENIFLELSSEGEPNYAIGSLDQDENLEELDWSSIRENPFIEGIWEIYHFLNR